ncbi:MAG: hypothetical protein BWY54_00618 [Candidatus Dependentiae bacterium ADurb.Bin331]|nr:MAG: hypothetical protein BWY54_00618 [Candidatus Dependentiae bacterium ADurb.Bin331]
MIKKKIIIWYSICFFSHIWSVDLTISQPGLYTLGNNIQSLPTGADSIINITTSDVILDLGNRIIFQGNATANVNGITVNSGLSNITVQNGVIRSVTGEGIIVNNTCSQINFYNLNFESCATDGLILNGLPGVNQISNVQIINCNFFSCGTSVTPGNPVTIGDATNVLMDGCVVSGTTAVAVISGIAIIDCTASIFKNILIQSMSTSGTLTGLSALTSNNNVFSNILIKNNAGQTGFIGLQVNTSPNNLIENVAIIGNSSSNGSVICIDVNSASTGVSVLNCKTILNSSSIGNAIGFRCFSANTAVLNDCIALSTFSNGAGVRAEGFELNDSNFTVLNRCISSNSIGSGNSGVGILVTGFVGSSNCTVSNCLIHRNNGNAAATSFGVSVLAGTNNLFLSNIGFNNSVTAANQFSGVPAGSVITPAAPQTNNINTAGNSWNNVSIPT